MILFLDFDGVLHPDPCFHERRLFERAPRLAAVLKEFPEVVIVLSTAWRSQRSLPELTAQLPASLKERVIGTTPEYSQITAPPHLRPYRRHAECLDWLQSKGESTAQWVALDDRPSLFAPLCEQLIVCNSTLGFNAATANRLHGALTRGRMRLAANVDAAI